VAVDAAITSIGARARRLLREQAAWTVDAVFERSFYVRADRCFVCIGDATIGEGPLNALLAASIQTSHGLHVASVAGRLNFSSGMKLDWQNAPGWQPAPWPADRLWPTRAALHAVREVAILQAPPSSFARAQIGASRSSDPLNSRSALGVQALRQALATGTAIDADTAAASLLGLGHGLTPSGDDVLSGAVIMQHAMGQAHAAHHLATAIRRHSPTLTSPLSGALLQAACDGEACAAVHQGIAALIGGAAPTAVIAPLAAIGHSSGFDMLAGILIVAEAHAA
jgi:Protein of unknown function (DUF2877)